MKGSGIGFDWRRDVPIVAAAILFSVIGDRYMRTLDRLPLFGDESHWIGKSAGWFLLVRGQLNDPFWETEAIDQPLLVPYVFGVVASLSGYDGSSINRMYDFSRGFEENRRAGCIPDEKLLRRCRVFSGVCGLLATAVAAAIAWRLAGPVAGLAALAVLGLNPHYMRVTQRAMSEGMLGLWLLVGWLLCMAFSRSVVRCEFRKMRRWTILLGVVAGLSLTAKLTGVVTFIGIALVGGLCAWWTWRAVPVQGKRARSAWRVPLMGSALALVVGYAVFIGQSPATWRNPFGALQKMLAWRAAVTANQQLAIPEYAVRGAVRRVGTVSTRLWHDLGTFGATGVSRRLHVPWLDGWVALGGLLWLVYAERKARLAAEAVLHADLAVGLLWSCLLVVLLMFMLQIDNDRYYLPGLTATSVVQAVGIGAMIRYGWQGIVEKGRRSTAGVRDEAASSQGSQVG